MTTLEEALREGRGTERPFRCPVHEDHNASASVNVVKGLWVCYACGAKGSVDGKKAPSLSDLSVMLEPDQDCRIYPDAWLELFRYPEYWRTRFPDWLIRHLDLGEDPFTGDATFPVRTPHGLLAGVGRRKADPGTGPRYMYPPRWSAASTLFPAPARSEIVVLVEGAADAAAVIEVGAVGLACYGSGLHMPQVELVARSGAKLVLLGFDMDEAGERGARRAREALEDIAAVERVAWSAKDPADTPVEQRIEDLALAVASSSYGEPDVALRIWQRTQRDLQQQYERFVEEAA